MPVPAPCAKTKHARAFDGSIISAETRRLSSTVIVAGWPLGGDTS